MSSGAHAHVRCCRRLPCCGWRPAVTAGASSANFTPNTATAVGATPWRRWRLTSGRSDCWTAINGNVYNVTAWATRHPGNDQNIYRLCGIDGSSAFTGQHGDRGERSEVLAEYKVGTLS